MCIARARAGFFLVVDLDERHKAIVREALLKCFAGI
jgi:hypothetical protein